MNVHSSDLYIDSVRMPDDDSGILIKVKQELPNKKVTLAFSLLYAPTGSVRMMNTVRIYGHLEGEYYLYGKGYFSDNPIANL